MNWETTIDPRKLSHKQAIHAAFGAAPNHEKDRSAILALESGRMPLLPYSLRRWYMSKKTLRHIDVAGKRVLVRVDFNVPLEKGKVSEDTRIRAALPTIQYLLEHDAQPILCSHLGRPKGKPEAKYSIKPVAERLGQLLDRPVEMASDCVGPVVEDMSKKIPHGGVLLLENLRFHAEEEANDAGFARALGSLADVYVNDAFGSAHRAHASTAGVPRYLPAVAGFLMEKELTFLGRALAGSNDHYWWR
jgi:phosphoglycerate kinase